MGPVRGKDGSSVICSRMIEGKSFSATFVGLMIWVEESCSSVKSCENVGSEVTKFRRTNNYNIANCKKLEITMLPKLSVYSGINRSRSMHRKSDDVNRNVAA